MAHKTLKVVRSFWLLIELIIGLGCLIYGLLKQDACLMILGSTFCIFINHRLIYDKLGDICQSK